MRRHPLLPYSPLPCAAKTVRNENSSRFGRFCRLLWNTRGELLGATVDTYLLEKVRLVTQARGERNYHVFYQVSHERGRGGGGGGSSLCLSASQLVVCCTWVLHCL
jgi:hypothetical protein